MKQKRPVDTVGPRQLSSNITFGHTYRFISTSSTATAVTPTSLLAAAGSVCYAVNANVISIFGSIKVNRIKIWTPVASQGANATCSVLWSGTVTPFNQDREISDTSVSVSKPAHIDTRPPAKSLAAFWQTASTNNLFIVTAPTGSIIDVSLSMVLQDEDSGSAPATVAVASGTLGTQYYLSLDPNATHRYTPVSLNTTF